MGHLSFVLNIKFVFLSTTIIWQVSELAGRLEIIPDALCVFTIESTAHQLHAQSAGLAANHRDDADVLGHDRRVKKVGLCAVVICVSHENLQHTDTGN